MVRQHCDVQDDYVPYEQLVTLMNEPKGVEFFSARGLSLEDDNAYNPSVKMFLDTICAKADRRCKLKHRDTVPLDAFIQACMQMKGDANSLDVHVLDYELHQLRQDVRQ